MGKLSSFACSAAYTLGFAFSMISAAQAADMPVENAPDEIVVTARRVEERIQEVPISIQVFNQRNLTDLNIINAQDLALYTPSLSTQGQYGPDVAVFGVRGFYQDTGTSAVVGSFFADVVEPRGGFGAAVTHSGDGAGPGSFFDLQNVQVLKGPQGTLFGRNTVGGDILLVPKKPTDQYEGYIETSVGNYGLFGQQAVVNLPLTDNIRFRLGVDHKTRDGWEDNISGIGPAHFADVNYIAARGSLVIDFSDHLENYTIVTYSESNDTGIQAQIYQCAQNAGPSVAFFAALSCTQLAQMQATGDRYAVGNSLANAYAFNRQWQVINTTTYAITDSLTIKNISSYAQLQNETSSGLFGDGWKLPSFFGPLAGAPFDFVQTAALPGYLMTNQGDWTEELQVHGDLFGGRLDWQAGGYMEGSDPLARAGYQVPELISCLNLATYRCIDALGFGATVSQLTGDVYNRSFALYGQDTYSITDELKLTTGFRWSRDVQFSDVYHPAITFPVPFVPGPIRCVDFRLVLPTCLDRNVRDSQAPTWVINLQYEPTKDLMVYVTQSRGYRQGGTYPLGPVGLETYGPEHVDNYEAGFKSSFHGNVSGVFNGAFFYDDYRDQQISVEYASSENLAPLTATELNAGHSHIWGLEFNTTISPYKGLNLGADYTYLFTRIDELIYPPIPPGAIYDELITTNKAGQPLPFAPRHKFVGRANYELPLDPNLGPITLGLTYAYNGQAPTSNVKAYDTWNLNLNWESVLQHPFDLEFFMTNVGNRFYANNSSNFLTSVGFNERYLGEPRMFGGRLRWHF